MVRRRADQRDDGGGDRRRHARDPRFSFGTGRLGELAGYSSALILAVVAMLIGYESLRRFVSPAVIRFDEAIVIAVVGLAGHHHHHDHNLRSAYLHVLADAFTSVLAIGALVIARWAVQLLRSAGAVLLDRVTDLHVWRVGPGHFGVIAAIAPDRPETPDRYRERLEGLPGLSHVPIEVQPRAAA